MGLLYTIKGYRDLPRDIIVLFFARIINCIGNFVFPFLAMFLTEKMGMSSNRVGKFMMIAAISGALGSIVGGKLSDHIGRKKIILIFQSMAAIMLIPCGALKKSILIPWFLILYNFFGGAVQPANSAMVADLTDKKNRQQAFSLLYLGVNIGVAIGPFIAGVLYKKYIRWIFWGDAITTGISLILVTILVKETIPSASEDKEHIHEYIDDEEKSESGSILSVMLKRPALLVFSLVSIIYSFVYAQSNFAIPLQVKALFPEEGALMFGTLMSVNAIVVVFFTVIIIHLTRKNKSIFNIALSGIFYAVGFGMLYYTEKYSFFIISTIIWTTGEILSATNQGVYIANHTPRSHRGRVNSIMPIISGIGNAIGPRVMGVYIENREVKAAWPIVFILSIIGALLMYVLSLKEAKTKSGKSEKKSVKVT
ncbi:MDR family MFS transporter [Clostridium sp.]|jgi:MFS family permease|uniref:MDR family MFS transporter n=1 Tax=Clostridium sp. TaxID=1506 RepID=UPI0039F46CED